MVVGDPHEQARHRHALPGVVNVRPHGLVDAPSQDVHGNPVAGDVRRDFDVVNRVGVMGDLHRAGDGVLIGQREFD